MSHNRNRRVKTDGEPRKSHADYLALVLNDGRPDEVERLLDAWHESHPNGGTREEYLEFCGENGVGLNSATIGLLVDQAI